MIRARKAGSVREGYGDRGRRGRVAGVRRARVPAVGTVAAIAAATLALSACTVTERTTLQQGDPAPVFTAASYADGAPVSVSDYLGQVLIVNLWATWCHPCRTETPYLQAIYDKHRDEGLRILGVSVDLAADSLNIGHFLEEMGVSYDIAVDPEATSQDIFMARGLPTTVVIDREGTVAFSWIGPIPEDDPIFEEAVEEVLGR